MREHEHHSSAHKRHDHHAHHAQLVEDFRRRFWVSLVLTIPILVLSPLIQQFLGYTLEFPGSTWVLWALSSAVFFYGGWPFLKGLTEELGQLRPGMMTLISLAITVAYWGASP